jgi:cytochrome c oxidase subunit 1/cytochrome c oxidase subunit I+III
MGMPRRIYTYQHGLGFDGLNLLVTLGAFTFGVGILLSIINLFVSLRIGAIAGRNPWNSDGLEWDTDSPPPPYGSAHIPLVASRHPLWDDFEEAADPECERTLDHGRLTAMTTTLDAEPDGIATIPEDSLAPILMSLALLFFFITFSLQMVWTALILLFVAFLIGCFWMWPRTEKEVV